MVEQGTKEEAIPSDAHGGESRDKKAYQGGKGFKKKNKASYADKKTEGVPELLRTQHVPKSTQAAGLVCMYHVQEWIQHTNLLRQRRADPTGSTYPTRQSDTS